ncbi:regulator of G-protein signaling 14-like isoform X2 [Anguilla anguilla]|uniref:regulator of G-protein signaling 14-like isoform X2 n=1 Tax=Anguilla anguilla TaxID=7936 RepID=UPI0015AAD2BE|nr:regulator of G-protein signaling 14-like isoform X2 [Anguilla anguilla]
MTGRPADARKSAMETAPPLHHRWLSRKPAGEPREKKVVTFQELSKGLSHFATRASLRRKFGKCRSFVVSQPLSRTKVLAASDGELNVAEAEHRGSSHSLNSNSSLPSMQCGHSPVGTVASWAVSFERLLEDPTGVLYFTAFLKSEVSAENILFWQACEKFRQIPANQKEELMREARSIYSTYLSSSASSAINIDDTARTEEGALEDPKPEMFNKAQQQIFKLMKFDSYTRFVRSQLYQNCMLADVEGKLLPDLGAGFKSSAYRKSGLMDSPSPGDAKKFSQQKKKARAGKSLPYNVEPGSDRRRGTPEGKATHDKQREKRGSWGAELHDQHVTVSRRESQCSVKSTSSVELGYLSVRGENGRSSPRPLEQERAGGAGRAEKYCCVFLPDGTASLTPARSGLSVRDMLVGLCEKRGFPLSDVIIYLQTKDKVSPQQPLSLDQDSAVLRDQQVTLELRVTFTLEVAFTGKAMGIMAKSSKTLAHTLASVLQKHQLRSQDAVVTMSGSKEPLNLSMSVFPLANKRLLLDRAKAKEQASSPKLTSQALPASQEGPAGPDGAEKPLPSAAVRNRTASKSKNAAVRRACDIDDLISKTQCFRVEDQRGLLRKEDLVIPPFLMQARDQGGEGRTEKSRGETPPPQPAEAPPPACADSAPAPATAATSEDRSELGKPADGAEKTVPEPGTTSTGPVQRTGPPVCSRETTV